MTDCDLYLLVCEIEKLKACARERDLLIVQKSERKIVIDQKRRCRPEDLKRIIETIHFTIHPPPSDS